MGCSGGVVVGVSTVDPRVSGSNPCTAIKILVSSWVGAALKMPKQDRQVSATPYVVVLAGSLIV